MTPGRRLILAAAAATALLGASAASSEAAIVPSALGIPCAEQGAGGVQFCQGDMEHRVASWDGVPLDTNVVLPPVAQDGPYPLIVFLHGWGDSKHGIADHLDDLAQDGYAVLTYTARGFGNSCGNLGSRLADPVGCAEGWIHLADVRYEVRDTQFLAGKLEQEGLALPDIGVTGVSYGGGQSMMLATLKDRVMLPNGSLTAWQSPDGTPMSVAAAAPIIPWSDLAEALMPNGRKLDYQANPSYGSRVGIGKQSYLTALYALGAANFYAPPGTDQEADITTWFARIQQGEPYDDVPLTTFLLDQVRRFHSALYLEDSLPSAQRREPAPLLIYNAWIDDLFPAEESLTYANKQKARHPGSEISLFYAGEGGHSRANLTAIFGEGQDAAPGLGARIDAFWEEHLDGGPDSEFGIETHTQGCDPETAQGPFTTGTWAAQHPGEVRHSSAATQTISSLAGNPSVSALVEPFTAGGVGGCASSAAVDEPGLANYRLPAATGSGYTLLGSPTVIARIGTADPFAQVVARLWDVAPGGQQRFVTRAAYRPDVGQSAKQVFQLDANGWFFAPGHVAKLELLGRDPPYARPSNSVFSVDVSDLELRLPVRESPDGGQILPPAPPVGAPAARGTLAGRCANLLMGTAKADILSGTNAGDRIAGRAGADTLDGRAGADCVLGQNGADRLIGGTGRDRLVGGRGADRMFGGPGPDRLFGGRGADRIFGGPGPDRLFGGRGRDRLIGGAKADRIFARDRRRDLIRCGPGRDFVKADRKDRLRGCERVLRPRRRR